MRRHAKATSAGSSSGRGASLGSIRRAFAPRGSARDADGSGAPPARLRLVLLGVCATAFLLLPASLASAEIIVSLGGTGTGTVASDPAGINCSNTGGAPGPSCGAHFPAETPPGSGEYLGVKLTPTAASDSYFVGWSGEDLTAGFLGPPCTEGAAIPCVVLDSEEFGFPSPQITATFELIPDPPLASTGAASGVGDTLATLHGSVDPEGSEVETCGFEYGTTTAYGAKALCTPRPGELGEGTSEVAVSAQLQSLEPGLTYHYRLSAGNLGGTSKGEDRTFTTTGSPLCANATIRAQQGINAILLPDCMALEMVSPPQKENTGAEVPTISADGERVKFYSLAGLGGTEGVLNILGDIYVATRGPSGWTTQATTPPPPLNRGWNLTAEALSLSPNFTDWFQVATTERGAQHGEHTAYRHYLGGTFEAISPLMKPVGGSLSPHETELVEPAGASADHSHLFFIPGEGFGAPHSTSWLAGDPAPTETGSASALNLYLAMLDAAGEPSLQLAARDKNGKAWGGNCGAALGHFTTFYATRPNRGAVSADGTRAYLSTRPAQAPPPADCSNANKIRILKRTETPAGPEIEELIENECTRVSPPCDTTDGDDYYQGASIDQTRVYFTTTRQLANSDLDTTADLYLYDSTEPAGERLTQVSAGGAGDPTPGQGAKAEDIPYFPRISGDGSRAYFIAEGVLTTTPNAVGDTAGAGEPNLYLWNRETGATAFIATFSSPEAAYPVPIRGRNAGGQEVGGDGHILLFQTKVELTSEDTDGSRRDDYRYDAETGALRCVSCPPGGGGAFDLFPSSGQAGIGTDFAEEERWASEDGDSVVFATEEALLPHDEDSVTNYYLWRDGQLTRMPGVAQYFSGFRGENRPAISADGSEVAFATFTQLLPQDGDGAPDVYLARIGGGYPIPPPHVPCKDEACQEPFAAQPADQGAASDSFTGPGNVRETAKKNHRKHRKKHHKKKHSKQSRRASHEQGGQK